MRLYDTHCHLQDPVFDQDREAVIERARSAGVVAALAVAEDLNDAHRVLEIADRHPDFIVPAIGVHPDRAPLVDDREVDAVERLLRAEAHRLGAVGEIGLDHRPCWDDRARARQQEVFRRFLGLAGELRLPVTVHSRGAGRHAVAILSEEFVERACLHAFDGRAVFGEQGARGGIAFSIPPSVIRSRVKQKLVPRLPLASLLLESDSPVLGPDAEARNEPANLVVGLTKVAELAGTGEEELAQQIEESTARVFPLLAAVGRG